MSSVWERPREKTLAFLLALGIAIVTWQAAGVFAPSGHSAPASGTVSATSAPAASAFTASPDPDDEGVSASFDASSVCLSLLGGCSYSYSGLPSGCAGSTSATFSCTPSATGTFSVNATATWACPLCVTNSATLSFTVNSYPEVTSVAASPSNLDVGQSTYLNVTVSGGTYPITFTWSNLPGGCSASDTNALPCRPSGTGSFTADVSLQDAVGGAANGSVTFSVAPALSVGLAVAPAVRDLGGSVTFTATVSGGQSPYSEAYENLPPGCASADSTTIACTPTLAGTYQVTVRAIDSVSSRATASASLQVVPPPNATLSVSPSTVDVGQNVTFTATVSNGSGSDRYSYANLPSGCSAANVSTFSCAPTSPGTFSVVLTTTDSQGISATATTVITVNPAVTVQIKANITSGLAPLAVTFGASLSGGTAPFAYEWRFAANASSNLSNPRYVFVAGGNYSVSLTVTDAVGASTTAFFPIAVTPPSNLVTFTISFFVNPSGCGPITLNSILLRDGSTEPLPAATYPAIAPTCPGFAFTQWVPSGALVVTDPAAVATNVTVDGAGSVTAELTAIATHGAPPAGGSSVRSLSSWLPYLPLIVGAVIALLLMRGYWSRRQSSPVAPADEKSPPTPPAPAGSTAARPESPPAGSARPAVGPPSVPTRPTPAAAPPWSAPPSASPWGVPPPRAPPSDRPQPPQPAATVTPATPGLSPPRFPAATASKDPSRSRSIGPPLSSQASSPSSSDRSAGSAASAVSAAPRPGGPATGEEGRAWPPSRIWDIGPTPNSPKKPDARRSPRDAP